MIHLKAVFILFTTPTENPARCNSATRWVTTVVLPVLRFDATTLITGTRRNSFSANAPQPIDNHHNDLHYLAPNHNQWHQ